MVEEFRVGVVLVGLELMEKAACRARYSALVCPESGEGARSVLAPAGGDDHPGHRCILHRVIRQGVQRHLRVLETVGRPLL